MIFSAFAGRRPAACLPGSLAGRVRFQPPWSSSMPGGAERAGDEDTSVNMCLMSREDRRRLKKKRKRVYNGLSRDAQDYFDVYGPRATGSLLLKTASYLSGPGGRITLHPWHVQRLILWVLGEVTAPKWVFVKNKPLVRRAVLVVADGLTSQALTEHKRSLTRLWALIESQNERQRASRLPQAEVGRRGAGRAEQKHASADEVVGLHPAPLRVASSSFDRASVLSTMIKCNQKRIKEVQAHLKHTNKRPRPDDGRPDDRRPDDSSATSQKKLPKAPFYVLSKKELEDNKYPIQGAADAKGFVRLPAASSTDATPSKSPRLFGVDCEMVVTASGFELARATVVNESLECVYDELVKPPRPIVNYNTAYSGITEELLRPITRTLQDVQRDLSSLLTSQDILVGHSLENDLRALGILHENAIDTALLYPHRRGPPLKLSLRKIAERYLNRKIQMGEGGAAGHSSLEDAQAALELAQLKIRRGPTFGVDPPTTCHLFRILGAHRRSCGFFARANELRRFSEGSASAIPCEGDAGVSAAAVRALSAKQFDFTVAHLREFVEASPSTAAALDKCVAALHGACSPNTLFILVSGQGPLGAIKRLQREKMDARKSPPNVEPRWTLDKEATLKRALEIAQGGIVFACVKQNPKSEGDTKSEEAKANGGGEGGGGAERVDFGVDLGEPIPRT